MQPEKAISIFGFIILLTSCSSVRRVNTDEKLIELNEKIIGIFVGTYHNKSLNSEAEIHSLWSTLKFNSKEYGNWRDFEVKIQWNSKNRLLAELIYGDQILETKLLKGSFENCFYRVKNQTKVDFSLVLLWMLADSSIKVALTMNNDLVVLRKSGAMAFLAAFPVFASNASHMETKYKLAE